MMDKKFKLLFFHINYKISIYSKNDNKLDLTPWFDENLLYYNEYFIPGSV